MSALRYHAPYMEYAKTRLHARFDLGGSNILACSMDDLPGAREALALSGDNDNGYAPLIDAIAARYGATPSEVTTAGSRHRGGRRAHFEVGKWKLASLAWLLCGHRAVTTLARV